MEKKVDPQELLRYAEVPIEFYHTELGERITVTVTEINLYEEKSVLFGRVTDCSSNNVSEFENGDMIQFSAEDTVLVYSDDGELKDIGESIRHENKPFSVFKHSQ